MKKPIVLLLLLCIAHGYSNAQKIATWKGGTPGRNTEWNCPGNWKEGRVPNEFSSVVIPDISTSTFSYPVVRKGTVEISSLQCAPGAKLTVLGNAKVMVLDTVACKPEHKDKRLVWTKAKHDSLTTTRN
ncbi:MAG: hypothetical protein ACKVU0_06090 [Saprospiraceae bacterium]